MVCISAIEPMLSKIKSLLLAQQWTGAQSRVVFDINDGGPQHKRMGISNAVSSVPSSDPHPLLSQCARTYMLLICVSTIEMCQDRIFICS